MKGHMRNRLLGFWCGVALLAACGGNVGAVIIPGPEIAEPLNGYPGWGYTHEALAGVAEVLVCKPAALAVSPCHPNIAWPGESTYKAVGWARSMYFVPLIGYLSKEAILAECDPLDAYVVWWSKAFHWQSRDGSQNTWINKSPWWGWGYWLAQIMNQDTWDGAQSFWQICTWGTGQQEVLYTGWPCHIVVAANHGQCNRPEGNITAFCYDEQAVEFAVKRLNTGSQNWVAPVCLEFDAYRFPTATETNCQFYVNCDGYVTDYYVYHMDYPPHVHFGYLGSGATRKSGLFPNNGARAGENGYPTWKTKALAIGNDGVQMSWPELSYEVLHWFDDPTVQNWYGY